MLQNTPRNPNNCIKCNSYIGEKKVQQYGNVCYNCKFGDGNSNNYTTEQKKALTSFDEKKGTNLKNALKIVLCDLTDDMFRKFIQTFNSMVEMQLITNEDMEAAHKPKNGFSENPIMFFLVKLAYGQSLELNGVNSLRSICVIYGKPCIYGDAIKALVSKHKDYRGMDCEFIVEHKAYKVTVYRAFYTSLGEEIIRSYSCVYCRQDAADAGYLSGKTKKDNWVQHWRRRCELKATFYACKGLYSDVFFGFDIAEDRQEWVDSKSDKVNMNKSSVKDVSNELYEKISEVKCTKQDLSHNNNNAIEDKMEIDNGIKVDIPISELPIPRKDSEALTKDYIDKQNNTFEMGIDEDNK